MVKARKPGSGSFLILILDTYHKLVSRPVTIDEVVTWSIANGLTPPPNQRSTTAEIEAWQVKLAAAIAAGQEVPNA